MERKRENQEDISARCDQLARASDSLLKQLPTQGDRLDRYYFGILVRYRTVLGDIAAILRQNGSTHLTSAFILFRILLDDMIRLVTIWASTNPAEQLDQIDADAFKHRLEAMKLRAEYTVNHIPDADFGRIMTEKLDEVRKDFFSDPDRSHLFKDQGLQKLKTLPTISEALKKTPARPDWNLMRLSELNVLYKELSGQVHYSTIVFDHDRDLDRRSNEIAHFEAVQIYLYKELLIHLDFFRKKHQSLKLVCPELDAWFKSVVIERST